MVGWPSKTKKRGIARLKIDIHSTDKERSGIASVIVLPFLPSKIAIVATAKTLANMDGVGCLAVEETYKGRMKLPEADCARRKRSE